MLSVEFVKSKYKLNVIIIYIWIMITNKSAMNAPENALMMKENFSSVMMRSMHLSVTSVWLKTFHKMIINYTNNICHLN